MAYYSYLEECARKNDKVIIRMWKKVIWKDCTKLKKSIMKGIMEINKRPIILEKVMFNLLFFTTNSKNIRNDINNIVIMGKRSFK